MSKPLKPAVPVGIALVSVSSFAYGTYGVWITLIGDRFETFTQIVLRAGLAILLLIPVVLYRRQFKAIDFRRNKWWLFWLFIAALGVQGPMYYAIHTLGVGLGISVIYAGIVIGAFLFGWMFDNEAYTFDKLISTIFGLLGVFLIFSPSGQSVTGLGILAALVSGVASGAVIVMFRRTPYSPPQTTLLAWATTLFASLPLVFLFRESLAVFPIGIEWFYILCFAVATVTAGWFLVVGLRYVDAGTAGIIGLLEIVFAVLFGVILFSERPSTLDYFGIAAILLAAAIPYIRPTPSKSQGK